MPIFCDHETRNHNKRKIKDYKHVKIKQHITKQLMAQINNQKQKNPEANKNGNTKFLNLWETVKQFYQQGL